MPTDPAKESDQAKAQESRRALEALGAYQKRGRVSDDLTQIIDDLLDESDRGVVVILGSLLEDLLLDRLQGVFVEMAVAERKALTKAGGLLASFDDRITLARALDLIDADAAESLRAIKAMRNACAHSRLPLDFTTRELSDVLALHFDDETAETVRESVLAPTQRILFIALFLVLSRIIQGDHRDDAVEAGQRFFDAVRETIILEVQRYQKRKAQRKARASTCRSPGPQADRQ